MTKVEGRDVKFLLSPAFSPDFSLVFSLAFVFPFSFLRKLFEELHNAY
jgi:hypothetical protein